MLKARPLRSLLTPPASSVKFAQVHRSSTLGHPTARARQVGRKQQQPTAVGARMTAESHMVTSHWMCASASSHDLPPTRA